MREIEIKVHLRSKDAFMKKLSERGIELSAPVVQRDQVFGIPGVDGGADNSAPWLRIRTETKDNNVSRIFTLKKSITNQMDSIEHETEIADASELAMIIGHLGFEPYSDTVKTRQKAHSGDIEICVDTVEGLGDFVEAERLTEEDADYKMVSEELWRLLEAFGATRKDHVTDGYDVLIRKKQGLKG
jgi:adenylate cyclase class 2